MMKASSFHTFFGYYKETFKKVAAQCESEDLRFLKQLAANVFSKWYGRKVSQSLRVVEDITAKKEELKEEKINQVGILQDKLQVFSVSGLMSD